MDRESDNRDAAGGRGGVGRLDTDNLAAVYFENAIRKTQQIDCGNSEGLFCIGIPWMKTDSAMWP